MNKALSHQALAGMCLRANAGTTRWSVDHPMAAAPITMVAPLTTPLMPATQAGAGFARAPAICAASAEGRLVSASMMPAHAMRMIFPRRCPA